jgi:hypothetical protein
MFRFIAFRVATFLVWTFLCCLFWVFISQLFGHHGTQGGRSDALSEQKVGKRGLITPKKIGSDEAFFIGFLLDLTMAVTFAGGRLVR